MPTLFDPYESVHLATPNRIVMAPMTRSRATPDGMPTPPIAVYYAQRATAGLLISEGIQPSLQGQSNPMTPGLVTDEQVEAWKSVTAAVHANGGRIVAQIMHGGRVGHREVVGLHPVGPSAIAPAIEVFTSNGPRAAEAPRELTTEEVAEQVQAYATASRRAMEAGFDGVELHGANGYLIQQFLSTSSNHRDDQYGGSIDNRIRFVLEALQATADAIGSDRVGIRLSPGSRIWDIEETDVHETYDRLLRAMSPMGLAFVHLTTSGGEDVVEALLGSYSGTVIVNPSAADGSGAAAGSEDGQRWLDRGADLVSYGRHFIANPDLVERFRQGLPLHDFDPTTMYWGDEKGYIDYQHYQH